MRELCVNNKLVFIDSPHVLSLSLNSLIKNLSKDDIKCYSQKFDSNALDLVMHKGFYYL